MANKLKRAPKTSELKKKNSVFQKPKIDVSQSMGTPVNRSLYLQRAIGNQMVQRLYESGTIQTKLTIGQPNDKYEQEADRIADQVMRLPESQVQRQPKELEKQTNNVLLKRLKRLVVEAELMITIDEALEIQLKRLAMEADLAVATDELLLKRLKKLALKEQSTLLPKEDIEKAIKYNKARAYPIPVIKIIQRTVGAKDNGTIDSDTVRAIAVWQFKNDLTVDGRVGRKTMNEIKKGMDEIDALIMQYVDMKKKYIPERGDFTIGKSSDNFSFAELSCKCRRHTWQILTDELLDGLEDTRVFFDNRSMRVNSGYRCPQYNVKLKGSHPESRHIYGQAADIHVADFNKDGRRDYADWLELASAAKLTGAQLESFRRTGSWVHMQWGY